MSSYYRKNNLVTKRNQSFFAPNLDVFSQEDDQKYNGLMDGQPIAYNPITGKSLNAAGVATAEAVRLGVGHSTTGGLLADTIRHVGGNEIDLCQSSMKIKVQQPGCPTPQVLDFEADCMKTGRDYLWVLDIDDFLTRSFMKEGVQASVMFNLREDLETCSSCSEEENTDRLMSQLALKINNKWNEFYPKTNKLGVGTGILGIGVWAAKKFGTAVHFSLADSAVESSCTSGCAVKGLKGMTADGMTPLVFVNVVDPSAPTQTLMEQIPSVINQINKWLKGVKGSAYLKKVDCCSYEIEVNTCLENLAMTYHDDAAVTQTTSNSFVETSQLDPYINCGTPAGKTYASGVRIFVDPLELPCFCEYPDGNPPSYFGRTATITTWGEGWNNTSWHVVEVEPMNLHIGTGYEVQQNELLQTDGGEGYDYDLSMDYSNDRAPRPGRFTQLGQAVTADCTKMYCIWSIVVRDFKAANPINHMVRNVQSLSFINVPRADEDTIGEMEEMMAALAERGFCSSATIECIPASS